MLIFPYRFLAFNFKSDGNNSTKYSTGDYSLTTNIACLHEGDVGEALQEIFNIMSYAIRYTNQAS